MLRLTLITTLATTVSALAAATVPASAQQGNVCAQRDAIVERLQTKYGESRQGLGLQRNNGVVEIFASESTGTWTIVVTMPTGISCLMAAGESWETTAQELGMLGEGA